MENELSIATLRALRRILRATDAGSRRVAVATGLTPSQLLVLRDIEARAPVTSGGVARSLKFSHGAITTIVDRLVALGLVTRTRGERDKRQVFLDTTPEGSKHVADAPDLPQQTFLSRFHVLAPWEQAMILAGTERLADLLGADEPDAAPLLDAGRIDRADAGRGTA